MSKFRRPEVEENILEQDNLPKDNGKPKDTITINEDVYKIKHLKFKDGLDMFEDITVRFLPSLGSVLDLTQHNKWDGSPKPFTEALGNLSKNLDGETLSKYSEVLFEGATVNGEQLDLEHFSGNWGAWRKLFWFALQENMSSFFEDGWATMISDKLLAMLNQNSQEDSMDQEPTE